MSGIGKIHDISPLITSKIAVFPGDVEFSRAISMDFDKGHHLGLSSITTTLHVGAHADASNHYHKDGVGIAERPLDRYIGDCQVIRVSLPRGERIRVSHLNGAKIEAPRVLFHTGSFPNPDKWNHDFNSLSPELIDHLASQGVQLVGIDTPSVDPADSKALESHQALYKNDLSVLEGLILDQVNPGVYTLVALPLKIKSADASPVRAILLEKK